jgi:uncharacterized membrane protein
MIITTTSGVSTIIAAPLTPTLIVGNVAPFIFSVSIDGTITNQLNIEFTGAVADARAVAMIEAVELIFA